MAISQTTIAALAATLFQDTANAATVVAIKASSASVSYVEIDNTANAAVTYVKFFNVAAGSVTLGTTAPDAIIMMPASIKLSFVMPTAWVFGTALSVASVTAGGTAGVTPPGTPITVRVIYT